MFTPKRTVLALHFGNDSRSAARPGEKSARLVRARLRRRRRVIFRKHTETPDRGEGKNVE